MRSWLRRESFRWRSISRALEPKERRSKGKSTGSHAMPKARGGRKLQVVQGEVRLESLAHDERAHPRRKPGRGKGEVVGPSGESGPLPYGARWNPPRAYARDEASSFVEAFSLATGLRAAKHGHGVEFKGSDDFFDGDFDGGDDFGISGGIFFSGGTFSSSGTPGPTGSSGGERR